MTRATILKTIAKVIVILAAIWLAWGLRSYAVKTLNVDYDEDDYLRAAQQYASLIREGDWRGFQEVNYRPEHPPLAKLLMGLSLQSVPEAPLVPDRLTSAEPDQSLPRDQLQAARTLNALFGTMTVALLAVFNPLAGLLLAGHAFTIKYVSQVMLEALPALTSLCLVLCYQRWKKKDTDTRRINGWLIASSIFLGMTAASKYIYCLVGIAVAIDWFLTCRERGSTRAFWLPLLAWGVLAVIVFFALDPYLWQSTTSRLQESLFYHSGYASGASEVQSANFAFYQPLVFLSTSPAALNWQRSAFPVALDSLIAILAVIGFKSSWQKHRVFAVWILVALVFLLLWPVKWPQYILVVTAPLCMAAALGLGNVTVKPVRDWMRRRREGIIPQATYRKGDLRKALPWLIPGVLAFLILTIFPLVFQAGVSLTNFSSSSLRDAFNGGLWRAIWGGLSGQVPRASLSQLFNSERVLYLGLGLFVPVFDELTAYGVLVKNILWTILSVAFQTGLGLGAALLLWRKGTRLGRFWQAVFILPWAIPEMIGALMWWNVFMPGWGWLSLAVEKFGAGIPFGFLNGWEQTPNLGIAVLLISATWYGFPFMMLAASAGLKMIPGEVFDASAMDGANGWQTLRYVTGPLLLPLVVPALIIRSIFAFNQFYLFQAFFVEDGTLATLSYTVFRDGGEYAISAAINILTVILLVGFAVILNRRTGLGGVEDA